MIFDNKTVSTQLNILKPSIEYRKLIYYKKTLWFLTSKMFLLN